MRKQFIFFTPNPPIPLGGGGVRSYYILKALSEIGDIDLVIFNSIHKKERDFLNKICRNIIAVESENNKPKSNLFRKFLSCIKWSLPFLMSNYELNGRIVSLQKKISYRFEPMRILFIKWFLIWFKNRNPNPENFYFHKNAISQLRKQIDNILSESGKTLIVDFNYFLPFLTDEFNFTGHKIIGNSHNSEFQLLKQQQSLFINDSIKRNWNRIQCRAMKNAERESLKIADNIFCCSIEDKKRYSFLYKNADISVIPNGVDTKYFYPFPNDRDELSILFTGTMSYSPNSEGVKWFANKVFPLLINKYPSLKFIIAGKYANMITLSNDKNIQIVSSPDDIRPCFSKASIYIVPLFQGGGTRIKILEAAAMQKPVVTTRIGAEGLEDLSDYNILFAETAQEFFEAISLLLEDSIYRNFLAENLRSWVLKNYSWLKISSRIKELDIML